VHLIVVELMKMAEASPNRPNLHFMAARLLDGELVTVIVPFSEAGESGIGSKNSEPSAVVMCTSAILPTSSSSGSILASKGCS